MHDKPRAGILDLGTVFNGHSYVESLIRENIIILYILYYTGTQIPVVESIF